VIRRREFVTLLGGTTVAWPLATRAQQPALPVVGISETESCTETLGTSNLFGGQMLAGVSAM
jgi:hypothetical protein